jgi:glutathione S-transferase
MLVAKAKNISMDVVYINLDNRPEWLENELGGVESHPVPIIELENGTLIRSMILNSEFLDNTFPVQGELCPKDLSKKINDRVLIDEFDTVMAQLFRDIVFGIGLKSPEKVPALIKEFEFGVMRLGEELDRRGTKFFGGNEKPGMVDFMIWPWFERKPIYKLYYPSAYDYEQTSARMTAWADDMKEVPAVKSLGLGIQVYYEFYSGFRTGNRDFNMLSG